MRSLLKPLLEAEQSQLSHLNHLCGLLLDSLQCVHVSFESGNPELDPVLQMLHHC